MSGYYAESGKGISRDYAAEPLPEPRSPPESAWKRPLTLILPKVSLPLLR